jgi:hypothetical protein
MGDLFFVIVDHNWNSILYSLDFWEEFEKFYPYGKSLISMLNYFFYYASHNPKGEYGLKPD